jgi:hypothetical protein
LTSRPKLYGTSSRKLATSFHTPIVLSEKYVE